MTDEPQLRPGDEEVIDQEQPVEPEQPAEVDEPVEVEDEEEQFAEQDQPTEPQQPSRRKELRIQKLVERLRSNGTQPQRRDDNKPKGLNYREALDADDETIQQLETDRNSYGQNRYAEGLEAAKTIQFHTRLEVDAPRVSAKYPVLDEDSDKFHAPLANSINQFYLATVGYDPGSDTVQNTKVRYADFVDSFMELVEETAATRTQASAKNIARQAAQTGIRPDGSSAKRLNLNKNPADMTDEELDAIIAQGIPKR